MYGFTNSPSMAELIAGQGVNLQTSPRRGRPVRPSRAERRAHRATNPTANDVEPRRLRHRGQVRPA